VLARIAKVDDDEIVVMVLLLTVPQIPAYWNGKQLLLTFTPVHLPSYVTETRGFSCIEENSTPSIHTNATSRPSANGSRLVAHKWLSTGTIQKGPQSACYLRPDD
jgi:hypothetical protein